MSIDPVFVHQVAASAMPDHEVVWASSPEGEAWCVVDYGANRDEPVFGVVYFDGDESIGVCEVGFASQSDAVNFALSRPMISDAYDLIAV